MIRKTFIIIQLLYSLTFATTAQEKGYQITYTLHGVKDTMAWFCQVYGGEVTAIDSCVIDKGTALFRGDEDLEPGVYKIIFNDTLFTDIICAEKVIWLESRLPAIIENMKVHRSLENELLFAYWRYYFQMQDTLDQVIARGRELYYASQGKPSKELDELQQRADRLEWNKHVYIQRLLGNNPNFFAPKLIWSFQKPDYRSYLMRGGKPYESESAFYRNHFFERLDFSDKRMLHTEVLYVMIKDYLRNFATTPSTELYIELVDEVLTRAKANDEVYQYCIELFLGNFEAGVWDKVFIHLVEQHYLSSPLGHPKIKEVYRVRVQAMKNTSIGEKVPEVCGTTTDGKKRCLQGEMGTRTLLLFWSLGCEHCESILPGLVNISREYSEKGLKIFAFVLADDHDSLQEALDKFGLPFTNVSDYEGLMSGMVDRFNINITPVMYLLDEKGVITDKPTSIPVLYANLVVRYRDQ